MSDSQAIQQEKIICTCTGTTQAKIEQVIAKGADNLDKIESATGANTGCKSCDVLILEILSKAN
ncbi:MAG: (2Fe-2S)-binding protein [Methyloprofundus sp.]|nr:(2Fe-2S)-binding protein [Methyloprofundus sp.]